MKILFFARHYSYLRLFESADRRARATRSSAAPVRRPRGSRWAAAAWSSGSRSSIRTSRSARRRAAHRARGRNSRDACGSASTTCATSIPRYRRRRICARRARDRAPRSVVAIGERPRPGGRETFARHAANARARHSSQPRSRALHRQPASRRRPRDTARRARLAADGPPRRGKGAGHSHGARRSRAGITCPARR